MFLNNPIIFCKYFLVACTCVRKNFLLPMQFYFHFLTVLKNKIKILNICCCCYGYRMICFHHLGCSKGFIQLDIIFLIQLFHYHYRPCSQKLNADSMHTELHMYISVLKYQYKRACARVFFFFFFFLRMANVLRFS